MPFVILCICLLVYVVTKACGRTLSRDHDVLPHESPVMQWVMRGTLQGARTAMPSCPGDAQEGRLSVRSLRRVWRWPPGR